MPEPRWLNVKERAVWLRLFAMLSLLPAQLDSQLRRDERLTLFEYYVLAMLSEADDRRLLMSDLAQWTNSTPSRLSHVIEKMERNGYVKRSPHPGDGRSTIATITDVGYAKIVEAAPGHVNAVRESVFDALNDEEVEQFGAILGKVVERIDPEHKYGRGAA